MITTPPPPAEEEATTVMTRTGVRIGEVAMTETMVAKEGMVARTNTTIVTVKLSTRECELSKTAVVVMVEVMVVVEMVEMTM